MSMWAVVVVPLVSSSVACGGNEGEGGSTSFCRQGCSVSVSRRSQAHPCRNRWPINFNFRIFFNGRPRGF